ncbi:uncharacterized protein PFL1_02940 [Pseudozyma flocculosa PF-1]|uniref:carnosine N-methyltransferase n=2 Tax=Pseudozyma flocculosa TaxID=84751 RepID=A0A5C3F1J1_9BASI|nr:uncharacterized protein PFL1_02940 [Pseudozyma flocculosa PF-1]EPQ29720.1 hypothetical protein PFL1_02940 [Pseudozyma flocculosa PF-1]SPO38298.1 uncharacterized protein PSFLO_03775 [Pseudozyma flocculosa]
MEDSSHPPNGAHVHGDDVDGGSQDDAAAKERAHFAKVIDSFANSYLPYCLAANNARRKSYYSLPRAHQHLLSDIGTPLPLPQLDGNGDANDSRTRTGTSTTAATATTTSSSSSSSAASRGFRARLDEIDDRIRRNADLLAEVVQDSKGFLGDDDDLDVHLDEDDHHHHHHHQQQPRSDGQDGGPVLGARRKRRKISGSDVEKIQSTLKQLVRDWSQEGRPERQQAYAPIVDAIEARFATLPRHERGRVHLLVPGSGLGRLAFDLASHGYSCQGNEFSFHMLLTSHHILNKTSSVGQHVVYPFVHSASNWRSADDMLRPVRVPDVLPSQLPPTSDFSMVAGEFCEVYSKPDEKAAWDAVATCFFIDTARNVVRYLETINHALPVGGYWINVGPLLWHFENSGGGGGGEGGGSDHLSIELTLDEVLHLCTKLGFEIEERKTLPPMTYTGVLESMLTYQYIPEFFVCRKVRDVEPAPLV